MNKKKILKRIGLGIVAVVAMLIIIVGILFLTGKSKLKQTYQADVTELNIPTDSASVARGRYLATTNLCVECHGENLSGGPMIDDPAFALLTAPNLTSGDGGLGAQLQVKDWIRAIRHGINREKQSLWLMPSEAFTTMNDQDLAALIAYLKQLPPVNQSQPAREAGPILTIISNFTDELLAAERASKVSSDHAVVEQGVNAQYGAYLAGTCRACHGEDLTGGIVAGPPGSPPSRNLTPHPSEGIGSWSEEDFFTALRQGKRPDGSELDPTMPRALGQMNDDDLRAVWFYLQTVQPIASRSE